MAIRAVFSALTATVARFVGGNGLTASARRRRGARAGSCRRIAACAHSADGNGDLAIAGARLDIGGDAVIKAAPGVTIVVERGGRANVRGTVNAPVVLTCQNQAAH